jgi:hypothetical protein
MKQSSAADTKSICSAEKTLLLFAPRAISVYTYILHAAK